MLKFNTSAPLYLQVVHHLKKKIAVGEIQAGEKLPSGRDLSIALTINPNTVARVYKELEEEGYCYTKRGLGTFVTDDEEKINSARIKIANDLVQDIQREFKDLKFGREESLRIIEERWK